MELLAPGCWLLPGPALTTVTIWGVKQQTEGLCLSLALVLSLNVLFHQIKPSVLQANKQTESGQLVPEGMLIALAKIPRVEMSLLFVNDLSILSSYCITR